MPSTELIFETDVQQERARLPPEWRSWIAENLLGGVPDDEIIAALAGVGHDRPLVTAAMAEIREDPCYAVAAKATQRLNKLKSILDVRRSLTDLSFSASSIERRTKISQSEFLERYYAVNRPVIITGLLSGTPAERWTPEYLAEICRDASVQIMAGRQSDARYELNSEAHKRDITMPEYVKMVTEGGPSNDYYLVANNGFFDVPETQALLQEVPQLPDYLDPSNTKRKVFFWFGPAGTITPLHHDVMNVMVAQVFGRKRFTLLAPEQTPYVYNETAVYGEVNCSDPDYSRHPLYREASPIHVEIGPGDVLFIPVGWWHYVRSLETSIMVSYINFRFPNAFEWFHPDIR